MDTSFEEELLKLIEKAKNESQLRSELPGRVDKFIEDLGITSGKTKVPNYIIYYTYVNVWHPSLDKLSRRYFFKVFAKQFESGRTGKLRYYKLNSEAFDLSREGKLKAKHYDEKKKREVSESKKRFKSKRKT